MSVMLVVSSRSVASKASATSAVSRIPTGAFSPGIATNLDAFITTMTGDVDHAGNTSIYTYSYGKLFKYL